MALFEALYGVVKAILSIFIEVSFFWQLRLLSWWSHKSTADLFIDGINGAQLYEEWEAAAFQLDELHGNDLWRQNPTSKFYDYRLIYERLQAILEAREDDDILSLVNLLRSGLVRNLGNITAPQLFNRAYAGTKLLLEDYITQIALAIEHVAALSPTPSSNSGLTSQAKLDLLHDTRQAFGRSALVLQGGAIFGLCHIGVVKALHLRGLLPRIIAGTATGALVAALVGVHADDELLEFLNGERIDLSAFASRGKGSISDGSAVEVASGWLATLFRRTKRFVADGYFLDVRVLEECVRANVGEMTFEEAYIKTKRVLNITLPTTNRGDMPSLLNYLTAPHVLIWSAAVASNSALSAPLFSPVEILCKDSAGNIRPWSIVMTFSSQTITGTPSRRPSLPALSPSSSSFSTSQRHNYFAPSHSLPYSSRDETPLTRIAELFNVNHFIVSQARPSIAPFLQTGESLSQRPSRLARRGLASHVLSMWSLIRRVTILELQHRLRQLDTMALLPLSLRRFLLEDVVLGATTGSAVGGGAGSLTLVPEIHVTDLAKLLDRPTKQDVEAWILRGERSVWPAVVALRVRCAVEVELDRAYQIVRRRKPMDAIKGSLPDNVVEQEFERDNTDERIQLKGSGEKRRHGARNGSLANSVPTLEISTGDKRPRRE